MQNKAHIDEVDIQNYYFLVVEDDITNQNIAKYIFNQNDVNFKIVSDGFEAVNISQTEKFDVILMDLYMPKMDGFTATQIIRNDETNPNQNTRIIATTTATHLSKQQKAQKVGMDGFLSKPFSIDSLTTLLQKVKEKTQEDIVVHFSANSHCFSQYDLSHLKNLVNNDEMLVKEMVSIFLTEVPQTMEFIQTALNQNKWIQLYDSVHKIKSNLIMMGMYGATQNVLNIESIFHTNESKNTDIEGTIMDSSKQNFIKKEAEELIQLISAALHGLKTEVQPKSA